MSTVYLVRHGQAGTRDAYDSLSELGERQSRLLGEHFITQGLTFASAYVGRMSRQQRTAAEIKAAYDQAGVGFPALNVDPGWDEFDLGQVYREIAPQLCEDDPEFRGEYEEMQRLVQMNRDHGARIHRKWMPCDTKIVNSWIRGTYPYGGENWEQFRERVAACKQNLGNDELRQNTLVVTSATPIAIWVGTSLELFDERVMQLAGVLYNTSYTVLRLRKGRLRLFTFNTAPHLGDRGLRTHR